MSLPTLRSYQSDAIDAALQHIEQGNKRIFISLPQGTGKVVMLFHLLLQYARKKGGLSSVKVLIVHDSKEQEMYSKELLKETFESSDVNGNWNLSTESVVVTNINSIVKSSKINELHKNFDLIICYPSERLGVGKPPNAIHNILNKYTGAVIIGIDSSNSDTLEYWGNPVYEYSMRNAINDQFLVPIKVIRSNELFDLKPNQSIKGIKDRHDIVPGRLLKLSESILSYIGPEKTIVFCPSQQFAIALANQINELAHSYNYSSPVIANTDKAVLNGVLKDFKTREKPLILTTVDMLSAGFDARNIKNIVLARNIGSRQHLANIISLGTRPHADKSYLTIIDFFANDNLESLISDLKISINNETSDKVIKPFATSNILFRDRNNIQAVIGARDLAAEVSEIIQKMQAEKGGMIGIFGKWGRGKTFFVDEIWKCILETNRFRRVDFHAWKYQDTPASWAYLYENLSHSYSKGNYRNKAVNWLTKPARILWLNIKRNRLLQIFGFVVSVLLSIAAWYLSKVFTFERSKEIEVLIKYFGIPLITVTVVYQLFTFIKKEYSSKAKDLFLKYAQKHSFKEHLGIQAEIQKEILSLLKAWVPKSQLLTKKIFLFIDDIDRCSEEKVLQIIDSLRVMLEDDEISKRIIVLAAIDERILKRAIKSKYRVSIESDKVNSNKEDALDKLTQEYLDKLFICGIKLGDLSSKERDEFFMEFIKSDIDEGGRDDIYNLKDYDKSISDNIDQIILTIPEDDLARDIDDLNISPIKRSDKLSKDEVKVLRVCLRSYENTTPRQIRIFYYRYLIAKNLLIRQYNKTASNNIWLELENSEILINLIIAYSKHLDSTSIAEHKINVLQTTTPTVKIFLMENRTLPSKDYGELLKVLDIVVAY